MRSVGSIAVMVAVIFAAPFSGRTEAAELKGAPVVIDGETLDVGGTRVRLYGIDAPDMRQRCEIRGRAYNCGRISRTALMDLVAGVKQVSCRLRDPANAATTNEKRKSAPLATCAAGRYDLSAGMVHTGWALAWPRTGTVYAKIEKKAAKERRGLWRGIFTKPWLWRPER